MDRSEALRNIELGCKVRIFSYEEIDCRPSFKGVVVSTNGDKMKIRCQDNSGKYTLEIPYSWMRQVEVY